MNDLEISLTVVSLSLQAVFCGLIFVRRAQRVLPFFSAYVCVYLVSSIAVVLIYAHFGFGSLPSYYAYWYSGFLCAIAWGLSIAELCRYELRKFPGIWALVWRILTVLSLLLVAQAALDGLRQPNVPAIFGASFLRDVSFASIAILAVLLGIRNYYGISLGPLQRSIATGMCVTCVVDVIGYTVFRNILAGHLYAFFLIHEKALWPTLQPEVRRVNDAWSTIHLTAFMVAITVWSYALRKQLPEQTESPALLPASVYRELSPAINLRLNSLNDRLVELLKS
jgi:hypothetical protein